MWHLHASPQVGGVSCQFNTCAWGQLVLSSSQTLRMLEKNMRLSGCGLHGCTRLSSLEWLVQHCGAKPDLSQPETSHMPRQPVICGLQQPLLVAEAPGRSVSGNKLKAPGTCSLNG